jgi:Protein of unknown function (DUF2628)
MASYVVMEPERHGGEADAESILLIRDGFSLIAFFLPVLWLLWHRLWIEAAFAFAVTVGLAALANVSGFGFAAPMLSLLVSLYAGLEGAALRIASQRRRGWRELGVIEADSHYDAETRYVIETGVGLDKEPRPVVTASVQAGARKGSSDPGLGLLLNPGRP